MGWKGGDGQNRRGGTSGMVERGWQDEREGIDGMVGRRQE